MHIPDGLLDAKTWLGAAAVAGGGVSYALRRVQDQLNPRQVPQMAVMGAFIFAAQMINFPIIGGTSGHLIGGALATITFGPWVAAVILTTVVGIQALVFQDGGITALGANILNMALVAPLVAYACHRLLGRVLNGRTGTLIAAFIAATVSVLAAAAVAAVQLAFSGIIPLPLGLPAMLFWHLFIGAGEGAITAATLAYLASARPGIAREVTQHE